MLKYALIFNNRVQNIIVVDDPSFLDKLPHQYQHVEFIGTDTDSKDVQIGYIWDGSTFFEDPEIVRLRGLREQKIAEEKEKYIQKLKEKNSDELTEQEKIFLEQEQKLEEMMNS